MAIVSLTPCHFYKIYMPYTITRFEQNIIRLWSSNHEGNVRNKLKRKSAATKNQFTLKLNPCALLQVVTNK